MNSPPKRLLANLSTSDLTDVQLWWNRLSALTQQELRVLCSPRWVSSRYLPRYHDDCSVSWTTLDTVVYIDDPEPSAYDITDFYEYAVNYMGELGFLEERHFHICTQHTKARDVLRQGFIPHSFACPLREKGCPMRKIQEAAGGKRVRLEFDNTCLDFTVPMRMVVGHCSRTHRVNGAIVSGDELGFDGF